MKQDVRGKMKVWPNGEMNIWTNVPRCLFMNLKEKIENLKLSFVFNFQLLLYCNWVELEAKMSPI